MKPRQYISPKSERKAYVTRTEILNYCTKLRTIKRIEREKGEIL